MAYRNSSFSHSISTKDTDEAIFVFSHLPWDTVLQRPHHIMTLLSRKRNIYFIEEPLGNPHVIRPELHFRKVSDNITVARATMIWDDWDSMTRVYSRLLQNYFSKAVLEDSLFWFYSPHYVDILNDLEPRLVIYDCMDELSLFKGAESAIVKRERKLLANAGAVFTGGYSLYEAKQALHPNVYCFPSSVDVTHFQKAFETDAVKPDITSVQKPIVGFYGVLDERIDFSLVETVADVLPDISFVLIGPIVKIGEKDLPRRANIHYLGPKHYDELPHYLKEFTIAWMPFALNDATKFISPTKTLEFMALQKPIVSTAITDVIRAFSSAVTIIKNPTECVAALQYFLKENDKARTIREQEMSRFTRETSWVKTAANMEKIIERELLQKESSEMALSREGEVNL